MNRCHMKNKMLQGGEGHFEEVGYARVLTFSKMGKFNKFVGYNCYQAINIGGALLRVSKETEKIVPVQFLLPLKLQQQIVDETT